MAGTQAPKGFGILFVLVGVPLIIWSAAGANEDLKALNASSNTRGARVEQCVANTAEVLEDTSIRRVVCECVVDKASARGALGDYGSYDRDALDPIIGECLRGDRD
jgi:hypothetical protein